MGRRFNEEPINLIHRIPSPEQLDAARPTKLTLAQMLSRKGAAFVRSAIAALSSTPKTERQSESQDGQVTSHDRFAGNGPYLAPESECRPNEGCASLVDPHAPYMAAPSEPVERALSPSKSVTGISLEEEIGELRTFLLRQQQDIVRLAAQIQELKAIVQTQQQVLLCFERESAASASFREERVASAVAKGNTLIRIRQKPVEKEKAMTGKDNPTRASLNL